MRRIALFGLGVLSVVPSVASAAETGTANPVDQVEGALGAVEPWHVITAEVALILLVGAAVLALSNGWGGQVLRYAHGGSLISLFVGLPATLAMLGLVFAGGVLLATVFGSVLGVPLLAVVGSLMLVWHAVGFVALGTWLTATVGVGPRAGVLTGAVLGGVLAGGMVVAPYLAGLPLIIVAALGIGASVRVSYGRFTGATTERQIPPKRQNIKQ